jgi:hypothetical protein
MIDRISPAVIAAPSILHAMCPKKDRICRAHGREGISPAPMRVKKHAASSEKLSLRRFLCPTPCQSGPTRPTRPTSWSIERSRIVMGRIAGGRATGKDRGVPFPTERKAMGERAREVAKLQPAGCR